MTHIRFDLTEMDRGGAISTSFSGRSEGREVRKVHELDKKDGDGCVYDVYIPRNTTSINPSFFLGLFYSSIKKLGMEKFKKKYVFCYDELQDSLRDVIRSNVEKCFVRAQNELNGITGLSY